MLLLSLMSNLPAPKRFFMKVVGEIEAVFAYYYFLTWFITIG